MSRLPEEGDASVLDRQHGQVVTTLANQQFGKIRSLGAPARVDSVASCLSSIFCTRPFWNPIRYLCCAKTESSRETRLLPTDFAQISVALKIVCEFFSVNL